MEHKNFKLLLINECLIIFKSNWGPSLKHKNKLLLHPSHLTLFRLTHLNYKEKAWLKSNISLKSTRKQVIQMLCVNYENSNNQQKLISIKIRLI